MTAHATPEWKHLRFMAHHRDYLVRRITNRDPRSPLKPDVLEMHKREIAALDWVLGQYPTPPPRQSAPTE